MKYAGVAERLSDWTLNPVDVGSIPTARSNCGGSSLVECHVQNVEVGGSIPSPRTIQFILKDKLTGFLAVNAYQKIN